MEVLAVDTMFLVEPDDDLAACVAGAFHDRYDVTRLPSLEAVLPTLDDATATVVFVNIEADTEDHVMLLERLRRLHPRTRIVVSYLSPPMKGTWARRICESADILVRKPYGVVDIDGTIRALVEGDGGNA